MSNLKRLQVGNFNIKDAIDIKELEENAEKHIIHLEELFKNKQVILLDDYKLKLFLNGVMLTNNTEDGIYRIYNQKKFIGTGIIKNKLLKRDIII